MKFKDIRLFNLVLLGRQIWRLLDNKNTLYYRVLAPKYFPDRDPFNPKHIDKPSYAWSSMTSAMKQLALGFGWQVGDGKHINISTHK